MNHIVDRYTFVLVQSLEELNGLFSVVKHYDLCYELCYQSETPEDQEADFLHTMSQATVYRIMHGEEVVGLVWLNNRTARALAIHVCFIPEVRGKEAARIGRSFTGWLLNSVDEQGEYFCDTLVGLTPSVYRHALLFAHMVGFKMVGTIKNAAEVHGEVCDMILTQMTRKDVKPFEGDLGSRACASP